MSRQLFISYGRKDSDFVMRLAGRLEETGFSVWVDRGAIKAGAADFMKKPLDKESFVTKVKSLLPENGNHKHLGKPLTQSEDRVLRLVLNGKSNQEIASLLSRSRRTIEVHRANMMHKLGVDSLADLVKRAAVMGLMERQGVQNQSDAKP